MTAFNRKELIKIRNRAEKVAKTEGLNTSWQRAYNDLAKAADHLDAMIARCSVPGYEYPDVYTKGKTIELDNISHHQCDPNEDK